MKVLFKKVFLFCFGFSFVHLFKLHKILKFCNTSNDISMRLFLAMLFILAKERSGLNQYRYEAG